MYWDGCNGDGDGGGIAWSGMGETQKKAVSIFNRIVLYRVLFCMLVWC